MNVYIVVAVLCILEGAIGLVMTTKDGSKWGWGILLFLLSIFMLIMLFVSWLFLQ